MAAKRKNYAKCKVWGDGITMTFEGPILGCMSQMLTAVPNEYQQKFIDYLQKEVVDRVGKKLNAREENDYLKGFEHGEKVELNRGVAAQASVLLEHDHG